MAVRGVENLCPDFFAFWEQARGLDLSDQKQLWCSLYEGRHRAIFDVYYGHFGSRAALDQALQHFPAVVARLRAAAPRVERTAAETVPRCAELFQTADGAVPIVVLVGLFCSNAWVWPLRGEWTAFLAAEMVALTRPRRLPVVVAPAAEELRALPPAAFAALGEPDGAITRLYFGLEDGRPQTGRELAARFGLNKRAVQELVVRSVARLLGRDAEAPPAPSDREGGGAAPQVSPQPDSTLAISRSGHRGGYKGCADCRAEAPAGNGELAIGAAPPSTLALFTLLGGGSASATAA